MKVAIIHDWLTGMRGGEKCLEVFCELFPKATLFTLLHNKGSLSKIIENMEIRTSFIQKLPKASLHYRHYLPLFPRAIESFDLSGYDFILSSSHCVAKAARPGPRAYHLCYCYTPMRYAWLFYDQYFGNYPLWKRKAVSFFLERLKRWDLKTLSRVNDFVAISHAVEERIRAIYQRQSSVIYPPVDVKKFRVDASIRREDWYLCVCALAPYKRVDVLVDAFNHLADKKLVIVGDGQMRADLERRKTSPNIKFLGWIDDDRLLDLYQRARAFLYVAEEDFGITPIEAQATGCAVIALCKGGVKETVIGLERSGHNSPTGIFFDEQRKESLIAAISRFEAEERAFLPERISAQAQRFSRDIFKEKIERYIFEKIPGALV